MWSWIISLGSRFLFSKQSGIMAIVLGIVAAGAGWYLVHTIQAKAELESELRQSNVNTQQLQRQLTKELAISKHLQKLNDDARNKPIQDKCPAFIARGTQRLSDTGGKQD